MSSRDYLVTCDKRVCLVCDIEVKQVVFECWFILEKNPNKAETWGKIFCKYFISSQEWTCKKYRNEAGTRKTLQHYPTTEQWRPPLLHPTQCTCIPICSTCSCTVYQWNCDKVMSDGVNVQISTCHCSILTSLSPQRTLRKLVTTPAKYLSMTKATFTCTCMYGLGTDTRPSRGATFRRGTRHAMDSVDTGSRNSPSKLGHTCNGHGTTPRCSCVNGRARAQNNGRQQRDLFAFEMAFRRAVLECACLPRR